MSNGAVYDEDYFIHGKESGKSLYTDYRWLPNLTIPMARRIVEHCGIEIGQSVLDFGCARGYLVKALRYIQVNAFGVDVSEWAIRNSEPELKPYLNWTNNSRPPLSQEYDWIIAKDVLEHVPYVDYTIQDLMKAARKGVFVVVPLSTFRNGKYVVEDYEKDVTHIHRMPLEDWLHLFLSPDWKVEVSYRVIGIKDNYYKNGWEKANGFITARRI